MVRCVICQLPFHKLCFNLMKVCPCSGGSSLDIAEMSQMQERTSTPDVGNNGLSSKSSADTSLAPDCSVQVNVGRESKIKISGFLTGIWTSKLSSSEEVNSGHQDSIVLDMISGPLEL